MAAATCDTCGRAVDDCTEGANACERYALAAYKAQRACERMADDNGLPPGHYVATPALVAAILAEGPSVRDCLRLAADGDADPTQYPATFAALAAIFGGDAACDCPACGGTE